MVDLIFSEALRSTRFGKRDDSLASAGVPDFGMTLPPKGLEHIPVINNCTF